MSFLSRVAGLFLRDRVISLFIHQELGVELLLLLIEKNQLMCLGHLVRMPPGHLPGELFQACPIGKRQTQDILEGRGLPAGNTLW